MRSLYLLAAAAAVASSTPAFATITFQPAHVSQGTLVHNTGTETTAFEVIANLGQNGPNIVHLNGLTSQTNQVRMQQGSGQSDFTGAELSKKNTFEDIFSGNIFLTGHAGMDWIEFGLTPDATGTVSFILTNTLGQTFNFDNEPLGPGNTHFGFLASGGDPISNVFFSMDLLPSGGQNGITDIKQVRILRSGVPEPATWAMMLAGFGAVGIALRRSRKRQLPQIA